MKFYIIDDDINIVRVLENIIEDSGFGEVIKTNISSVSALEEIEVISPDIILIDLLMPELDGINFIKECNKKNINSKFIMISQVSDKKIIGRAYEAGVKFFINKPINKIEVINVIENFVESFESVNKLNSILGILDMKKNIVFEKPLEEKINYILNDIGISGEKGANEILMMCLYIEKKSISNYKISEIYENFDKSSTVKQRVRRALSKGLSNIAALGIEDFMNVKFTRYSNNLFDFENIKYEMDYLREKRKKGGKIHVSTFLNNLITMANREI